MSMALSVNGGQQADFEEVAVTASLVAIVDLDLGGRSVTNDAERVVALLYRKYGERRIAYRDTAGEWAELLHQHGEFAGFSPWVQFSDGLAGPFNKLL